MARQIFRKKRKRNGSALGGMAAFMLPVTAFIAAVAIVAGVLFFTLRPADDDSGKAPQNSTGTTTQSTATSATRSLPKDFIDRNTFSPSVVLYDVTNQKVLYEKDAQVKRAPASLTKLMTALVAVKHTPDDYVFTVGDELSLVLPGSSTAGLWSGNKLTLTQILQGLLMKSGNDAAYVIAVHVGRLIENDPNLSKQKAVDVFCDEMNRMAKELKCENTSFRNPDGFDKDGHLTTASDMMKICAAALEDSAIAQVCGTHHVDATLVSGREVSWDNSNKLLDPDSNYYYKWATGLKTGTTDAAGNCLAASATKDGRTVIALVLGAEEPYSWIDERRWEDARGLLDLAFQWQ